MSQVSNNIYVYADESVRKGKYFSNFYGGALLVDENHNDVILNFSIAKKMSWKLMGK
ncbi:hypothetical protein [Legionella israelensis]|uniref:hypothetical protein n=1 Tax=Legionella israelensis TaxID=454 RepID=UPI000AF398F2|nr:hypothetical protein [Legionella israelensis]